VSTADLLDILSNGNSPHKVMAHMSKCFQVRGASDLCNQGSNAVLSLTTDCPCLTRPARPQAIDKLRLEPAQPSASGQRPVAQGMESCVGVEYVPFSSPLPLENKVSVRALTCCGAAGGAAAAAAGCQLAGPSCASAWPCSASSSLTHLGPPTHHRPSPTPPRPHPPLAPQVESYMNDIIAKMREELRLILRDSVADYPTKPRERWLFDWSSQMILVVNQIYWCQEVEQVGGP
jgi:hypothetical protein